MAPDWQAAYYQASADLAYTEEQLSEERDITDALRDEVQRLRGVLAVIVAAPEYATDYANAALSPVAER